MSKYTYSHHEERGEFTASVMDEMGNVIWSVKYPEYFEDDETGELIEASTIFDDGFMKNPNDLSGLYNYLLDLGLIADDDEIVRMSGYADGGAIPEGYHMMPDGTIMPDSAHMARGGVIGSSATKQGIEKVIKDYYYGSNISLHKREGENEYDVHNSKGKISGVKVIEKSGRFQFVSEKKMARGGTLETKIKKRLGKNFELPIEMAVYVPSTESANRTISKREFQARVDEVQEFVAKTFGGFSASEVEGGYVSDEKGLIQEDVVKVTAFSQIQDFENKFDILVEKIRFWADKWGQESIGFEFEGDLFYIDKNAKFNLGGEVDEDVDEHVQKLVDETAVPEEVWYEYASDMGMDILDVTSDPYFGTYVSEIGFAVDMVSNQMIRNLDSYLQVDEDAAMRIAEDMAIEHVETMSDEEIVRGTQYESEFNAKKQYKLNIENANNAFEDLNNQLELLEQNYDQANATEQETDDYDKKKADLQDELDIVKSTIIRYELNSVGLNRIKTIVENAKQEKISELSDEIYERITDDPIEFFVTELGYDKDDLPSNTNFKINYQSIADDLLHNYHVVEHEDRIYVFRNYKRGGEMPEEPKKALRGYYFPEDMYEVYVSAESPTKEKKYLKSVISARSFEQAEDLTLSKLERKYPDYKFEITDVELVEGVMADGGQTRFNYDDPYVTAKLNIEGNYVDILTWIPKGDEEKTAESLESLNSKFQDKKLIVLDVNDYPDPEYKFWDSMLDKGLIFGFTDEYDRLHVRNATMKDGGKINYEGYYYGGGRMSETQRCDYGAMIQAAAYKRPIGEHFSKYIQDLRNEELETEHRTFNFDGKYYPAKKYEDYIFAVKSLFNDLRDENGKLKKDADLVEYYVTAYFDDEDIKKYSAKELYEMWIDGKAQNVEKKKKGWFFKDGGGIKDAEALKSYMPKIDTSKKRLDEITNSNRVEVATKIDELAQMVETAKGRGEKPEFFDLCQISVPNTNIYCQDNLGIDRNEMPQFKGKARPNSLADKLPKDSRSGSVDTEDFFKLMLSTKGIAINSGADGEGIEIDPSVLKATQRNMVGDKVVEMYEVLQKDPKHPYLTAPIFVSNDGYVLDGHHRWAAIVSYNVQNPESNIPMKVRVIDMPITELVTLANEFSDSIGIEKKPANVGTMADGGEISDRYSSYKDKYLSFKQRWVRVNYEQIGCYDISKPLSVDLFLFPDGEDGYKGFLIDLKLNNTLIGQYHSFNDDDEGMMNDIEIAPEYQGMGLGKVLTLISMCVSEQVLGFFSRDSRGLTTQQGNVYSSLKKVNDEKGNIDFDKAQNLINEIIDNLDKHTPMAKGGKVTDSVREYMDKNFEYLDGKKLDRNDILNLMRIKDVFVRVSSTNGTKYEIEQKFEDEWNYKVDRSRIDGRTIKRMIDDETLDYVGIDGGWIYKLNKDKFAKGGKVTFEDKVEAIAQSNLKRKYVPKAVQKDYGKTFNREEAYDSARRIAGSMRKKEMNMAHGGVVEYVLYGTKVGKKDWEEEILAVKPFEFEITPKLLALTKRDGYDRLRVAKIDLSTPPDFRKTIKKADGGEVKFDIDDKKEGFVKYIVVNRDILLRHYDEIMRWTDEGKKSYQYNDLLNAIKSFDDEIEDTPYPKLKRLLFNYHVGELDDIAENIRDYKENGMRGDKKFKYGITYQTITPESAEHGDYEDSGWEVEEQVENLSEILKVANSYGIYEPSSSKIIGGEWWSSIDPSGTRSYYEEGEETYYSLHIYHLDGSKLTKEETEFVTDKLKSGRKLDWDDEENEWWADGGETQKKNVGGFIAGVALGAIGANYLAKNKKEVKSDKKEEEEIELTWREEIKQYIDKEDFDYAINEFSSDIEDKKFKDLKEDYIEASDNLKNYLEKNDVLDEDEDIYVSETIDREGFDYALKGYNDWSGVKDKKYQSLYKEYLKSREKLENYINKYASGGETKWIQSAIKEKGALRETAKRKGLIKGKQKLSLADLKKLEKGSKKTAKRAKLAETLKKLKK